MDMMMTSDANSTDASAHHHSQQLQNQQEGREEARKKSVKEARQQQAAAGGERKPRPQQDAGVLKCPRCDSTNTKFCYYNNYSMSQPRYLCKACRRYWTQGGSLRNVPVGGGCRRNKRSSSSLPSSSSSSINMNDQPLLMPASADFPNVLPTFMSTGGLLELTRSHHLSFAPLSMSNNLQVPAPTAPSFLHMLRGGFRDGSTHQSNGFYGGVGDAMPPPSFGFGVMQHGSASAISSGAVAAAQGAQWPTTHEHGNNDNGDAAAAANPWQCGNTGSHI